MIKSLFTSIILMMSMSVFAGHPKDIGQYTPLHPLPDLNTIASKIPELKNGDWRILCSGFFINKTGLIVTARHCLGHTPELFVEYEGKEYKARVKIISQDADTALLQIDVQNKYAIDLQEVVNERDTAFVLGYPIPDILGYELKIKSGKVLRVGDSEIILHLEDGSSCEGDSGGVVVNQSNQAIGVLVAGYSVTGSACSYYASVVPISKVIEMLNTLHLKTRIDTHPDKNYKQVDLDSVVLIYGR